MKKRNKITLLSLSLAAVALIGSSCTANFCSNNDKTRIAFAIEPGVSEYLSPEDLAKPENATDENDLTYVINDKVTQVVRIDGDDQYAKSAQLTTIIESAKNAGIIVPTKEYFAKLDQKVLNLAVAKYATTVEGVSLETITAEQANKALKDYGSLKFSENVPEDGDIFVNYRALNNELRTSDGYLNAASIDFEEAYISAMEQVVDTYRSCITMFDEVEYGNYGTEKTTVKLDKITWGDAWEKGGHIIEGLVVYPVAWLVDTFAHLFAGGKSASAADIQAQYATGVPQLMSLILVTVIVRLFIFLVTIKSTLSQRKMSELQPELARIQQKYPNANTNQAQKQRLAEEQMRLYKKNKINPLSQLLVLIVQFPIFIGVWGAMTGSAVLSTGRVMGLHLSDSIWSTLVMGPSGNPGWWTAFVLIILMSLSQFFSMKIPQWIQKAKTKKVARLGKNPAQKSQNRTANIVSYVMLIMIIIMGFTLPAAMGVYWFIGAIVSMVQTVLTTVVFVPRKHK